MAPPPVPQIFSILSSHLVLYSTIGAITEEFVFFAPHFLIENQGFPPPEPDLTFSALTFRQICIWVHAHLNMLQETKRGVVEYNSSLNGRSNKFYVCYRVGTEKWS